jgi:hypothetical protein
MTVFVTHDLYSGILILKTVVLVAHGGKEHILNAETKKNRVCHLIFHKHRERKHEPRTCRKQNKIK